jgi:lysyl-tRNA synthetase class 1
VRFSVQESLPAEARALPGQDLYALGLMVSAFSRLADWKADALHALVYSVAEETGTSPREIFRALYIVFLGKERGARMGWFLEALGREFVERRIIEAVNAGGK